MKKAWAMAAIVVLLLSMVGCQRKEASLPESFGGKVEFEGNREEVYRDFIDNYMNESEEPAELDPEKEQEEAPKEDPSDQSQEPQDPSDSQEKELSEEEKVLLDNLQQLLQQAPEEQEGEASKPVTITYISEGYIGESNYTNTSLGLRLEFPEDWIIRSGSEFMESLSEDAKEEHTLENFLSPNKALAGYCEMVAQGKDGSTIYIYLENLLKNGTAKKTERELVNEKCEAQYKLVSLDQELTVREIKKETVRLGAKKFEKSGIYISSPNGKNAQQNYYLRKQGDIAVVIIVTGIPLQVEQPAAYFR